MEIRRENDFIFGRNAVREALLTEPVAKILMARGIKGRIVEVIISLAREKKVPFHWAERKRLDFMAGPRHQGVIAQMAAKSFSDIKEVWNLAGGSSFKGPRLLFLDGITDPQNLGSILRSAAFFGVPGVVVPKWRSVPLTAAVVKASSGGAFRVSIAQVSNLAEALEKTKKRGFWVVGADMKGDDAKTADLPRPFVLVLGAEGQGLHHLIRERCDIRVSLKGSESRGGVDSLNVGASCAAFLHHFS